MKLLLISVSPAIASAFVSSLIFAAEQVSGVNGDAVLVNLLNYGGVGIALAFCFYLLREQSKENKEQLKQVTEQFTTALTKERDVATQMNTKLCDRVQMDHDRCKLDHSGLGEKLNNLHAKLDLLHENIKSQLLRVACDYDKEKERKP